MTPCDRSVPFRTIAPIPPPMRPIGHISHDLALGRMYA